MPEPSARKAPKKLSAETKWEIFLSVTTGEVTQADAARKWAVDLSTVDRHPPHRQGRGTGRPGPGTGTTGRPAGLAAGGGPGRDRAVGRDGQVPGHRAGGGEGKSRLGLSGPLPARVPAEVKELVLKSVDEAVAAGFAQTWACSLWRVSDDRVHRWRARLRDVGTLIDRAPGGHPVHGLLPGEVEAVLALVEAWGEVDRSHRKLAHRGSYEHLVWVAPSTLRRVLAAHGLVLPDPPARGASAKTPWPDWLVWEPNHIWIWDVTHFTRARRATFAIVDVVSRYWVATLTSAEETSTQVKVVFERALLDQGLDAKLSDERLDLELDDPARRKTASRSGGGYRSR